MSRFLFSLVLGVLLSSALIASEQKKVSAVGIDENLGGKIPFDLTFTNDLGKKVTLGAIFNKPTLLMFVYFECPGLCTPLMSEVAAKVGQIGLQPGRDFQLVSVSFNTDDTTDLARSKKLNYLSSMKFAFPDSAWIFLTGDSASIAKFTDAVGYHFKKENDEFIHVGVLIAVSPDGTITRYLLGTEFLPFDIKMSLIEASEGKISPTIAKLLKFCFRYDAEGKTYVLNVTRISASFIILIALLFILWVIRAKSKRITKPVTS